MPLWFHPVFFYLWIAPRILLLVLLVMLYRYSLLKRFPIFSLYAAFQVAQWAYLFGIYAQTGTFATPEYRSHLATFSAVSALLRFGILYEVFVAMSGDSKGIREAGLKTLRWAGAVLFLLGSVIATMQGVTGFFGAFWLFDRTISLMQCGLLIAMFVLSGFFAIPWKNYAFGIALGFGVFETVELVDAALRSQMRSGSYVLDAVGMAAYHLCVLIWIAYLVFVQRSRPAALHAQQGYDIESWNRELRRLHTR